MLLFRNFLSFCLTNHRPNYASTTKQYEAIRNEDFDLSSDIFVRNYAICILQHVKKNFFLNLTKMFALSFSMSIEVM